VRVGKERKIAFTLPLLKDLERGFLWPAELSDFIISKFGLNVIVYPNRMTSFVDPYFSLSKVPQLKLDVPGFLMKNNPCKLNCVHRSRAEEKKNKNEKARLRSIELRRAKVEVTGIEPVSKHDFQKLSTCLFPN
jgi:hypothetical protein